MRMDLAAETRQERKWDRKTKTSLCVREKKAQKWSKKKQKTTKTWKVTAKTQQGESAMQRGTKKKNNRGLGGGRGVVGIRAMHSCAMRESH